MPVEADGLAATAQPESPTRPSAGYLPYLAIVVGVLALGFSALFVRWAAAPGPVTGFYRMALSSLILTPLAVSAGRNGRNLPMPGVRLAILAGLFLSVDLALWNTAVNITTAANATLFANTAPLWVALATWLLFRERLTGRFWVGLLVTLTGAAAVLGTDFLRHPTLGLGDLLALSAGVFYAGYYLATERGRRHLAPTHHVWLAGIASSLALLVLSLALHLPLTGYSLQTYLAFLGLALITQVTGYVALSYALGHLPASVVSPSMVGQPLVTALLAIPFLGEVLRPAQWVGGAAVIAGILLIHQSRKTP